MSYSENLAFLLKAGICAAHAQFVALACSCTREQFETIAKTRAFDDRLMYTEGWYDEDMAFLPYGE